MQLWFEDPAQQALADRLGATGREQLGKNPICGGLARPGREQGSHLHRAHHRRRRHPRRTGHGHRHHHPAGHQPGAGRAPRATSWGRATDFPVGTFAGYVSVYLPQQIEGDPTFEASEPTVTRVEHEFGHPVAIGFLQVPAGGEMTWSVTYTVPDAVTEVDPDTVEYRLDFLPQPTFTPGSLNVTIHLPRGSRGHGPLARRAGRGDAHLPRPPRRAHRDLGPILIRRDGSTLDWLEAGTDVRWETRGSRRRPRY